MAESLLTFQQSLKQEDKDKKTAIEVVDKQIEVENLVNKIKNADNQNSEEVFEAKEKIKRIAESIFSNPKQIKLIRATEKYSRELEDEAHKRSVEYARMQHQELVQDQQAKGMNISANPVPANSPLRTRDPRAGSRRNDLIYDSEEGAGSHRDPRAGSGAGSTSNDRIDDSELDLGDDESKTQSRGYTAIGGGLSFMSDSKGSLRGGAPDIDDMLADIDTEQETREEAQNEAKEAWEQNEAEQRKQKGLAFKELEPEEKDAKDVWDDPTFNTKLKNAVSSIVDGKVDDQKVTDFASYMLDGQPTKDVNEDDDIKTFKSHKQPAYFIYFIYKNLGPLESFFIQKIKPSDVWKKLK